MQFYHDFSALGIQTPPSRRKTYIVNQPVKEPTISAYLRRAIDDLRAKQVSPISAIEWFCSDGYYSMLAHRFGADICDGYDMDKEYIDAGQHILGQLDEPNVRLHVADVHDLPDTLRASIVINAGGLYHVADPLECLDRSYAMAKHYLIVQTCYTMTTDDPEYFETPAPGWKHGCRFSVEYLRRHIAKRGYRIIDEVTNVFEGNKRPEDRGNVMLLIDK